MVIRLVLCGYGGGEGSDQTCLVWIGDGGGGGEW